MPPAPRGSENFTPAQLKKLKSVAQGNGKLVYWLQKGQPVPDGILGAVVSPRDKIGATVDSILGVRGFAVRLDVFPLGIPWPEEFLVRFEHGMGG